MTDAHSLLPEFPPMADSAFAAFPDVVRLRNDTDEARLARLAACLADPHGRAFRRAELAAVTEAAMLSAPDLPLWPVFETALAERGNDISGISRVLHGAAYYAAILRRNGALRADAHFFGDIAGAYVIRHAECPDTRRHPMIRPLLKHYISACYDMPSASEHLRFFAAFIDTEEDAFFARACVIAAMRLSDDMAATAGITEPLNILRTRARAILHRRLPVLPEHIHVDNEDDALCLLRAVASHARLAMMLHHHDDIAETTRAMTDISDFLAKNTRRSPVLWHWMSARITAIRYYYEGDISLRTAALNAADTLAQDECIKDVYRTKAAALAQRLRLPSHKKIMPPVSADAPFSFTDTMRGFDVFTGDAADKHAMTALHRAWSHITKHPEKHPLKGHIVLYGTASSVAICMAAPLLVAAKKDGYHTHIIPDSNALHSFIESSSDSPVLLLSPDTSTDVISDMHGCMHDYPQVRAYSIYPRTPKDNNNTQEGADRFDAASIACYPPGKPFAMPAIFSDRADITHERPRLASAAARRYAVTLSALQQDNRKLIYISAANDAAGRAWMLAVSQAACSRGLLPLRPAFDDESARDFAEMTRLGVLRVPEEITAADIAPFIYAAFEGCDISGLPAFTAANLPAFWCGPAKKAGGMDPRFYRNLSDNDAIAAVLSGISRLALPEAEVRDDAKRYCIARDEDLDAVFIRHYASIPLNNTAGCRPARIHTSALNRLAADGSAGLSAYLRLLLA